MICNISNTKYIYIYTQIRNKKKKERKNKAQKSTKNHKKAQCAQNEQFPYILS